LKEFKCGASGCHKGTVSSFVLPGILYMNEQGVILKEGLITQVNTERPFLGWKNAPHHGFGYLKKKGKCLKK
jgi:hypothetical protein